MVRRTLAPLVAALGACALLIPFTAGAQVQFGANLNLPSANPQAEGCEGIIIPPLRQTVPPPPSCTLLGVDVSGQAIFQPTPGTWTLTQARVRTGPRTGPMRFVVLRALRSQEGSPPAGIICCTVVAASQVFTPAPNQVSAINTNLPMRNQVDIIDGERVEVVDRLGISLLNLGSSLPLGALPGAPANTSVFAPEMGVGQTTPLSFAFPINGRVPLIAGTVCPGPRLNANERTSHQQVNCATIPGPAPGPGPAGPAPGPGGAASAAIPAALRQLGIAGAPNRASVPVVCGAGEGRCTGTLAATTVQRLPRGARNARRIALPVRSFALNPGAVRPVSLPLPPLARRELARGGALPLVLTLRTPGGSPQTRRVVLRALPPSARATRQGAVRVLVEMPAQAVPRSRTTVQLRLGRAVAGQVAVATRPGLVVPATVRLGAAQRAQLARTGRLRMVVRATSRDAGNRPIVSSRPLTVLAAR